MKLLLTNAKGTTDIAGIMTTAKWSGDYQQAVRSLNVSMLSSPTDASVPVVECPLGAAVQLVENNETLFDGYSVSRTKGTEGKTLNLICYDRGFYLKRNKENYKFTKQTPESITQRIAVDFGITLGDIVATGVSITRNFLTGSSLYDIIATAYTLASQTTKKQYHIGFRGAALYITEKAPDSRTLVIKGGSNLIAATTTESNRRLTFASHKSGGEFSASKKENGASD